MIPVTEQQPRSDAPGIVRPVRPGERRPDGPADRSRYDLLLAAIPLGLLSGWILGQVSGAPAWAALAAGALAALPLLADGLALNPPR